MEEPRDNLVLEPQYPPTFELAPVQMCVKRKVKIARPDYPQLCYDGEYEVLQLFDTTISLDSWLNGNDNSHDIIVEKDGTSDSDIEIDSDSSDDSDYRPQDQDGRIQTAYWIRHHIIDNHHGHIVNQLWKAIVLNKTALDSYWTITEEEVALKCMSREHIRASRSRGRMSEDFVKEIAALQYLSSELDLDDHNVGDSLHVLTANTIMVNESNEPGASFAFIVMPYCSKDIYQHVVDVVANTRRGLTETEAKYWFKQMLAGLRTLQRARLCHRDLSPENFIVLDDTALVIDFGMSLRIPYTMDGRRHLMQRQRSCGKVPHLAPEYLSPEPAYTRPFDGHAIDIWSTGTVLLYMLKGSREEFFRGPVEVIRVVSQLRNDRELGLSAEALDLLVKMFKWEPENRLTLNEIWNHPFLQS